MLCASKCHKEIELGKEMQVEGSIICQGCAKKPVAYCATWFTRLRKATLKQLKNYRILPDAYHIHWPELDEDISLRVLTDGLESGCC